MAKIRYIIPYALDKNLAGVMNDEMSRAKPGEYIGFCDADTMFHVPNFGHIISKIVDANPGNYFTCYTNRTNCDWQRYPAKKTNDIEYHHKLAQELKHLNGLTVRDHTDSQLWSGHLMICPVDKWIMLHDNKTLLGVDNAIHRMAMMKGAKILLMPGIYVFHWYGNFNNFSGEGGSAHQQRDKSHLK